MQQSPRDGEREQGASDGVRSPALSRRVALRMLVSGAGMTILAACAPAPPAAKPTEGAKPTAPASAAKPTEAAKPAAPAATSAPAPAPKPTEGPSQGPSATGQSSAAAKPAPQPKPGGRVRYGLTTDLSRLDPHFRTPEAYNTVWGAYDRLTENDFQLNQHPLLAESWEVSSDYSQIKFNLRKGVTFHSGREFTSEDVKWNVIRGTDPKVGGGTFVGQAGWWKSIETPDKHTIVLKSDAPRPAMFDYFEFLSIVDKDTIDDPTKAVGTGPFVLQEWRQNDRYLFTKNKDYWGSGLPYLDEIEIRIVGDPVGLVAQLEGGGLDVIYFPALNDFVRLGKDPRFQAIPHPGNNRFYTVGVNVLNPPFDNKKVRQAVLLYAIDRKRFVDTHLLGVGVPQTLPWPDYSPAYEASKHLTPFDLDKARSLLAEAGMSAGFEVDFLPNRPGDVEIRDLAQMYQGDLAKLNIKLNIKNLESAAFFDQVNNRKYSGMYQATGTVPGEPATTLSASRGFDPANNNSGFANERYSQLIAQASAEPDLAKRKQIYSEINDIFLDEAFYVSLSPLTLRILASAKVQGIKALNHDAFELKSAWLA